MRKHSIPIKNDFLITITKKVRKDKRDTVCKAIKNVHYLEKFSYHVMFYKMYFHEMYFRKRKYLKKSFLHIIKTE